MSEIKADLKYTKDHEWIEQKDTVFVMGITDFAQASLGDITFIELPSEGDTLTKGDTIGSVESVKAVSDIYAPISGKILSVNTSLEDDPSVLNTSPFNDGWIIKIEASNEQELSELMNAQAYEQHSQN